jgi:ribosome-binding factor A
MTSTERARRLADRIKVIVAEALETRVKDPRLGFVTVTDARVTPDLREATVFYTVLGEQRDREESAAALASATGVLRTEVGRLTGVKFTPTLAFVPDGSIEHAAHLEELFRQVHDADEQLHRRASGATYAGDPDPYRPRPARDGGDDDQ